MSTTTTLDTLKINYLTQAQYDTALANSEINENEIYLTPQDSSSGETDPVFSASAAAGITSSDITNWNGKTSNTGTVTSITLKAGGGITLDTDNTAITGSGTRTISHTDTSSQASVSNSGRTYIQSITLDTYGHVTALSSATETVTDTDEKLKWTASTSSNTYYPLQSTSTATTSTANTLNGISFYQYYNTAGGYRRLDLGNATAWKSTGGAYGTIRLYGAAATYYGDLIPGVLGTTSGDGHLTANRTWTFPNASGTVALTSDIPTIPTNISAFTNDSGYITSADVPEGASAYTGTISAVSTTASNGSSNGFARGDHVHNITSATIVSALGFTPISTDSDENVKSTAVTAATTNYIVGSTTSTTTTGGLSKHASAVLYTTADSGTSGYTELRLGNTTATSSAGGKEGQIRLYGTNATYYTTLKAGAVASSNKTITFPNATGTVALTSDLSSFVTSSGVTSIATTSPISGGTITSTGTISHATSGVGNAVTTAGFYKFKYDTYGHVTGVSSVTASDITGLVTIPTNTDEKVKSTPATAATTYYLIASTSSSENTATTSKHASLAAYTTTDSGTGGYTQLRLGNTTATSSAGGKEGQIRLYGTTATYYVDLRAGAPSANRTITFPNKGGTVALTDDIPDVSGFITSDSDEKVAVAALTSGTTYYPILATGTGTATRQIDSTLGGLKYVSTAGTTSAVGTARLQLGNGTASGTANNEQGVIRLYGTTAYYTDIKAESGLPAANRTIYVPSYAGTMYLTCTSTTNAVGGATTAPVYVDDTGRIQAVTSIPYSLLTGTPTIPTDTNTTYTLTNALSSHKFTWTFTAGGSGSGSTTTTAELVAGTGITLTDDTTNKKITIASSVTNTDENVKSTAGGANTSAYYLTGSANSATETGTLVKHAEIYAVHNPSGASIIIGGGSLNYRGWINLYSSGASYYATLQPADNYTANRTITLPDKTGTVALTSDIPTKTSDLTNDSGFLTAVPASGVTAGTYSGGFVSKTYGVYLPSFTIDSTGRVTSATNLNTLIPEVTNSDANYYGNVISGMAWSMALRIPTSGFYTLTAGQTSATQTITYDYFSYYNTQGWVRVVDVKAWDYITHEPVIIDWNTNGWNSRSGADITLTVSIKSAHSNNIYYLPIFSYGYVDM